MKKMHKNLGILLVVMTALVNTPVSFAEDHNSAYQCVQSGQCLPLEQVLAAVHGRAQGELIGNDLDESQARFGIFIYRLTFLRRTGKVFRMDVDAHSGKVLTQEGR